MSARELVHDLAVVFDESATLNPAFPVKGPMKGATAEKWPPFQARFARLFELAIATGLAVLAERRPSTDALALLRTTIAADYHAHLRMLWYWFETATQYMGFEDAGVGDPMFYWGGQRWVDMCHVRSALEFLTDFGDDRAEDSAEMVERRMAECGSELFALDPIAIPPGMPRTHWWWFQAAPSRTVISFPFGWVGTARSTWSTTRSSRALQRDFCAVSIATGRSIASSMATRSSRTSSN